MKNDGAMNVNEIRPHGLRTTLKLAAGALRLSPPPTPGTGAVSVAQLIDRFRQRSGPSAFTLDALPGKARTTYAARLGALSTNPRLLHQQQINGCGMAAFLFMWMRNDLRNAIQYAIDLFEDGAARIGTLAIQPSADLLRQDYSSLAVRHRGLMPDTADWVMMSALRNGTQPAAPQKFVGDPNQALEAIVLPHELTNWMGATGNYSRVENSANAVLPQQLALIDKLSPDPATDVAVLMHTELLTHAAERRCRQPPAN